MGAPTGWQLSGNAPEAYEWYIIPALFRGWAHDLVETAALRAGERVLDVACGTGVVARAAAPLVGETGQVVGVDVNEGMLANGPGIMAPKCEVIAARMAELVGMRDKWETCQLACFRDNRSDRAW